ncbi:MAG: cytochrome P450 [Myxococcales bacterium]|nr:MAG: cytochrome P450 [Myxococcales bacterium]
MTPSLKNDDNLPPPKPIPRHKGHWLWGGTFDFQRNPADFVLDAHEKYGDVFVTRVLTGQSYFIRDPEVVNAINVTHAKHIYKPKVVKQMWKPFLGNGLVPNDGESWKRQHKLLMPGFHKMRVDAYAPTMADYTADMVRTWKDGEQRDFRQEMVELTLRVVAKTLFDTDLAQDSETVHQAMEDISEALIDHAQTPIPTPRWWPSERNKRMVRALDAMDGVIERLVDARRKQREDRGDLMSHVVFATDEQGSMSSKQMRDELMTLIFAGHETTAHTLTWAWYLLATNRDILAKAQQEIDQTLGGRPIGVDDLRELPYLEMCLKESLRRLPAVWIFAREAQTDLRLGDYFFPKGSILAISPLATGRNAKYFDEPMEFRPERWTREMERQLPKGAYVPFAAGPRVCLGKQFAMMEMRIILGTLIQNVDINLLEGFEPDFVPELSLNPGERGMQMRVCFRPDAPVRAGARDGAQEASSTHAA